MKVLSLCDGMSCGHIAFDRVGIEVEQYFAAEIKDIGIKVTKDNYPDTIHIGDVNKISFRDGVLYTENGNYDVGHIDLVMFGSPCQTFSVAMKADLRVGLDNKEKSGLFLECHRILKEVNPTFFFMENVARMKEEDKNFISELMGVEPIRINSSLLSAQLRDRFYWTNISGVEIPKDKGIKLQDILTSGYADRAKARALLVSDSRPLTTKERMIHRYRTTGFTTLIYEELGNDDSVRYMNQTELERCQTVPEGYTKCLTRNEAADVLGDGWTVDVIAHIFSYLPDKYKKEGRSKEMELKIYNPTEEGFVKAIEWNHEEIKKDISEKVAYYNNLVYTDEQIKDAKADRAKLNKFVGALEDKRKEIKKLCLAPYESFEKKMKEIVAIVQEPINLIDSQVKGYEDKQKQEKLEKIKEYFNSLPIIAGFDTLSLEEIFDDKWLNASVTMKSIQEAISNRCGRIKTDLDTLSNLPEFGFEAVEVYKSTLDVNKAITEARRMSEIAKRKAEQEAEAKARAEEQARLAAEAEAKKQEETVVAGTVTAEINVNGQAVPVAEIPVETSRKQWVSFAALLSTEDALALKEFFNSRNIEFKAI